MTLPPPAQIDDPLRFAREQWTVTALTAQTLWTRFLGRGAVRAVGDARLEHLLRHARERSPYYRTLWRDLPARLTLADLPVVHKSDLMANFDDWCTDPIVKRHDVESFLQDPVNIGARFADRYLVWTSSGTTGVPGIFIQDDAALAAYDALVGVQLARPPQFAPGEEVGLPERGARSCHGALVAVESGHFASFVSWRRVQLAKPWLDLRSFSVDLPLPELVAALDACSPAFLAAYPTVLSLLAAEQSAGRLHLRPVGLWSGGEALSPTAQHRIEQAFGCSLRNEYGASECLTIGYGCKAGWIHVNADWVILEPVDDGGRPTPAGELSHTVLLTNLANFLQPLIRYDLGDQVRVKPDPCACGNPLPAIQIEGRSDDVLTLRAADGAPVSLIPLALTTVVEEAADIHRFQIVQTAPDRLGLRLEDADRRRAGRKATRALRGYLATRGLGDVRVGLETKAPVARQGSGKLRQVIALRAPD